MSKNLASGQENGRMRKFWLDKMQKVAGPVYASLARGTLKQDLPVFHPDRSPFAPLEAFARASLGITPWMAARHVDAEEERLAAKYREMFQKGLKNAVDPASPDYMVFDDKKVRQPLVDAAFLCQSLLRAPGLAAGIQCKDALVRALRSAREIEPYDNNWRLFSAMVEAGLCLLGADYDEKNVDRQMRQALAWYKGDGAYGDGQSLHIDYYNSFVIQPMLVDLTGFFSKQYADVRETVLRRAQRLATVLERMVSPEGYYPFVGRSIAYRTGAFHMLAQAAWQGFLEQGLRPAQVRCALTAVIRATLGDTSFRDGWLQPGVCGRQEGLAEVYINTGSLYLCSAVFLPLGLDAGDAFWSDPDSPWSARKIVDGVDMPADHALADRVPASVPTQLQDKEQPKAPTQADPPAGIQWLPEIYWANIYHDTIWGSEWLLDQAVSPGGPGRWAVGYNFLYALYRILDEMRPAHVLELGLGQSTKLTAQYARYHGAKHFVVEHDRDWISFFTKGWRHFSGQTRIFWSTLEDRELDGQKYFAYQNFSKVVESMGAPCELVLVDGPFGGRSKRARRDIVPFLPKLLAKDFVIMIDDCGREGEQNLIREIEGIFAHHKIEIAKGIYPGGEQQSVCVLVSKSWRFLTSM